MSKILNYGEGTFRATDSGFINLFYELESMNYLSFRKDPVVFEMEGDIYRIKFNLEDEPLIEDGPLTLAYLLAYTDLLRLEGYDYDCENERKNKLYKWENNAVQVYEERFQHEYQEDADFEMFRQLLFKHENYDAQTNIVTKNKIEEEITYLLRAAQSKEEFTDLFIKTYVKEDFIPHVRFDFKEETNSRKVNATFMVYYNRCGIVTLYMNYQCGYFEDNPDSTLELPTIKKDEEMLELLIPHPLTQKPAKVQMRADLMKQFVTEEDFSCEVLYDDEYHHPCSVCDNKLKRLMDGCHFCKYSPMK